jgi:hypothetical protein
VGTRSTSAARPKSRQREEEIVLLLEEDQSDRWYMRNAQVAKSDVTAVSESSRSM